ncbi:hypothetical protein LL967_15280, partial [Xanthomonas campestris pv. zinniae]|nr:hypothetical protein [Xanthomonas campestris pv. zinniae]
MTLLVKCTVTSLRLNCSKYRSVEGGVLTARGIFNVWMPPKSYKDVLATSPAMVGGQGPCSKGAASSARCPHRSRDTQLTYPWGLGGGIHAANGPASGEGTAPDSWLVVLLKSKDTALQLAS